ncbi:MAG: glutamine synthetase [Aeromicrobium sp.]|jgi:glutamine synthetase|nr:glutamine synthetase [Aeromicrobium sp.]
MSDQIAAWLDEHDIQVVRIEGTNLEGSFIGKNVSPHKFLSGLSGGFAFADVAFGLDMSNVPQFGFAMPSWRGDLKDIFWHADLSTLVEWAPGRASVIGDFRDAAGESISACPRGALRRLTKHLADQGLEGKVAVEIEATVFEETIQQARAQGYQGLTPLGGAAGSAYHLAKSKDWEDYMRAVVLRMAAVGIPWEAYNDEAAPGQVEFNITPADPVTTSDHWARTRQIMREVAFEQDRVVTFMAKPTDGYGQASHLNVSLLRDGQNVFYDELGPSEEMSYFLGGLMATLAAATSFALPMITSYRRLVDLDGPPTTLSWGVANKSAAIRAVVGHPSYSRLEYRTPGADANVYLVLAAILAGGIAGLEGKIEPPEPFDDMAWCLPPGLERIPASISLAADALEADDLLGPVLGQELVDYWLGTRRWEWLQFHTAGGEPGPALSSWESHRYFELP